MSADIVWHNSQSNQTLIWFMQGNQIKSRPTVADEKGEIFVGLPWSIVGVSQGEIVWHNSQSNETQIWFMQENQVKSRATVTDEKGEKIFVGLPWSIVGASQGEIVWHNSESNQTLIWFMQGNQINRRQLVVDEKGGTILVGPPWSIVGVSQGNIIWHNSQSNETQIWFMQENKINRRPTVLGENGEPILVGPPWSIVGASQGEIVWHNSQSNRTQIWFIDDGPGVNPVSLKPTQGNLTFRASVVDEGGKTIFVGLPWSIVGVSPFSVPPPVNQPAIREFDAVDPDNGTTQLASNLALGGSAHLLVTNTGAFTLNVNAHDSGFDNIDYSFVAVLMTRSGVAFTFAHQGGVEGTSAGLPFGKPRRDDHAPLTDINPTLKDQFVNLDGATFVGKLAGTDALVKGVEGLIGDALIDAAKALGGAEVKAVIALVLPSHANDD